MSQQFKGSIEATGVPAALPMGVVCNRVAVSLDFGTGTVNLEWSLDNGATWKVYKAYTADANEVIDFGMPIPVRLNCSAYTAKIDWAIQI